MFFFLSNENNNDYIYDVCGALRKATMSPKIKIELALKLCPFQVSFNAYKKFFGSLNY